jgi:nucleoside-diphosphate-sugar epimerase
VAAVTREITWRILSNKKRILVISYTVKNLGSRLRLSISKAERELGWKPRIFYEEGFERAMVWLKSLDL